MLKKTGILLVAAALLFGGQQAFAAYADYIGGTNPVGWWGMNETGAVTSTADLSGAYGAANNQAGVNLGATYQGAGVGTLPDQAGFVSGAANRAVYFDGTADSGAYAHGAAAYDLNVTGAIYRYEPNGFAIEAWVKTDGDSGTADSQRFISTREWALGYESVPVGHRVHFTTAGKQDYFSTVAMPSDGGWHQVGVSFDGNLTATFYIDGLPAGTAVGGAAGIRTALSPGANTLNLGHRNTDSQHFKGWMDEAVLWGTQRTAADFAASYAAAIPEPATMTLLVLGGLGTLLRRRRMA